ncbi:4-alpha-glucanotransferase [Leptospira kanakyensis]|uniref:4-alpha-glucanotransferase n=1 Tax=Leptospira kanakyensis TaxID=2484968 RepID=A0A6N4QJN0_9LEPT|nr:4-alpha-glucanotransferase [Leptospira kanakyensis]TGK53934.1 4-alpha-glucanotransferase [Leptospira kanakyensis]TGK57728.1 4-alpha-glucanotransferase [Leptospira kanakyensis]TGK73438.1 4-alpha-glucanotransferase [Leptospira kanakyensis]
MEFFENVKKRRAGVLVSLPSIVSEHSFECGDIYSLIPLCDWAKDVGFSIIQLLPLNDTGFGYSPYSAISAFAIDPLYISLYKLDLNVKSRKREIRSLENHPIRIRNLKLEIIRKYYLENKKEATREATYFLEKHPWCYSYAAFRLLYEENHGSGWWEWPKEFQNPNHAKEYIFSEKRNEALFWVYLQKVAYDQLSEVKVHFEDSGVYLKGDMPILTSRNSCDVWEHPEYFIMDLQAGAPPDDFSKTGQTWGFPVLNWEVLEKSNYSWWKDRLSYLENFFHLYRIDHVIGMYRIWSIPKEDDTALKGWFHPQFGISKEEFINEGLDPKRFESLGLIHEFKSDHYIFYWDFWKEAAYQELNEETKAKLYPLSELHIKEEEKHWRESGEKILEIFESFSSMVPCAEDLGSVPSFIRESLFERQMIGIDVVRWTKSFTTGEFIPEASYRKNAISVLSTHDTSLVLDWWKNEGDLESKLQFFFDRLKKPRPKTEDQILLGLLSFVLGTSSLFSIQLFQDLALGVPSVLENPEKHRINLPGTADHSNWTYRFPVLFEEFASDFKRNLTLRKLLLDSGRNP